MMLGILMVDMAMMLILKNTLFAPADPWKSHLSLHCHSPLPPSQYLCQVFSIFASGIYTCDICRGYLLFFTSFNLPFRVFLGGPLNFKADSIWNSHSPMPKQKVFFSGDLPLIQIWSWIFVLMNICWYIVILLVQICAQHSNSILYCVSIYQPSVIEFLWYLDWLRRKELSRHFGIGKKWKNSSGSSGSNWPASPPAGM